MRFDPSPRRKFHKCERINRKKRKSPDCSAEQALTHTNIDNICPTFVEIFLNQLFRSSFRLPAQCWFRARPAIGREGDASRSVCARPWRGSDAAASSAAPATIRRRARRQEAYGTKRGKLGRAHLQILDLIAPAWANSGATATYGGRRKIHRVAVVDRPRASAAGLASPAVSTTNVAVLGELDDSGRTTRPPARGWRESARTCLGRTTRAAPTGAW